VEHAVAQDAGELFIAGYGGIETRPWHILAAPVLTGRRSGRWFLACPRPGAPRLLAGLPSAGAVASVTPERCASAASARWSRRSRSSAAVLRAAWGRLSTMVCN
jgi:hypothetical protein